jgi:hypothetical protein
MVGSSESHKPVAALEKPRVGLRQRKAFCSCLEFGIKD